LLLKPIPPPPVVLAACTCHYEAKVVSYTWCSCTAPGTPARDGSDHYDPELSRSSWVRRKNVESEMLKSRNVCSNFRLLGNSCWTLLLRYRSVMFDPTDPCWSPHPNVFLMEDLVSQMCLSLHSHNLAEILFYIFK